MSAPVQQLGRFGHHPEVAIDFCVEVEELESIAESSRLGLIGFGHEQDRATLDHRIEQALDFRVGADTQAVNAKHLLRQLACSRGFDLCTTAAYAGQPVPRVSK